MPRFPDRLLHSFHGWISRDQSRLLLAFKVDMRRNPDFGNRLAALLLALEDKDDQPPAPPAAQVNHTDRRLWVRSVDIGAIGDEHLARIEASFAEELEWIGPVYRLAHLSGRQGLLCPVPNVLLIKLRSQRRDTAAAGAALLAAIVQGSAPPPLIEDSERSKLLDPWHYFTIPEAKTRNAYSLRDELLAKLGEATVEIRFENMPLLSPVALVPADPLFPQQWNMTRVQAPAAWDISTGNAGVAVCVLDEGCDRGHPDLHFTAAGINSGTMSGDGSPFGNHGTACAGIVAAVLNNIGVAGMAGSCNIMPVAAGGWTEAAVAAGINYARLNGARVISMSFGSYAWDPTLIDPAIQNAFNDDLVMCAATHNFNGAITYPATNPLVIACGASDQIDNRKSPASPDGEAWGSDFGPQISIVAPGVLIPTTDRTGADGYVPGDYRLDFDGTSSATPHVAGLAALLRSQYPALDNLQVRGVIEHSAEKVGVVAYADTPGHASGTWNQEMGYGRINAYRALDLADVMIRDAAGDTGAEPGPAGGNFWDFSDVVVRIFDDNVFVPSDPSQSKHLELGQTNYLYVRVVNLGPREARNVVVNARLTPFVGTQFVYPQDWTAVDATHLSPTPISATFAAIPAGGEQIAKFSISAAQVQVLWDENWHPCVVVSVNADNDYAFATAPLTGVPIVVRRNNLAQRNLSVINVIAGASASLPFIAGHLLNLERTMSIAIDRRMLPGAARVRLALDEGNAHFPQVDLSPPLPPPGRPGSSDGGLVFLERTRVKTRLGCCEGLLTLEKGSSFDCLPDAKIGEVSVQGGDVILEGGARFVEVRDATAILRMAKQPGQRYAFRVEVAMPANAPAGEGHLLSVVQKDESGQTVGGASAWMVIAG